MLNVNESFREDAVPTGHEVPENLSPDEAEKAAIIKTLESTRGNKSDGARRLGITRKTLHKKLKEYGMMP
ncbi:MAG: helix-turn-helix domain-containing protein [Thermodesulfobacteriota bacterium]|nr:helix-turn-helix domain-containing protein [Thermodesulfobacteriota bacterium]